jgi:hypothetical protein
MKSQSGVNMNIFRGLLNELNLVEMGEVVPFPAQGIKPSHSQVLDADPEELRQVVSITKIYKNHKALWSKNKKKLDKEIAQQALQSLTKWADYFDYDDVNVMIDVLEQNKLL